MDIRGLAANEQLSYSKQSLKLKASTVTEQRGDVSNAAKRSADPSGESLGILQQEIRAVLRQKVALKIATAVGAYAPSATTTESLRGDLRTGVGQLFKAAPLEAADTLKQLRGTVSAAETDAAKLDDLAERKQLETATSGLAGDLDIWRSDAQRNVESSASVLSAESVLKQRSTIRIRTQEGDVVRLDIRRKEATQVFDAAVSDARGSASITEVSLSSKSKLVLNVKGDLNEQEMAAIQNVFAQAETIADEFFDGDVAAAFDASRGLQYDTEQLSRVKMKFRETEMTRVSYQATAAYAAISPASTEPVTVATLVPNIAEPAAAPSQQAAAVEVPERADVADAKAEVVERPEVSKVSNDVGAQLGAFLRNTLEGFENGDGNRYYYAESFKLSLLKSVLDVRGVADTPVQTAGQSSTAQPDSGPSVS